MAPSRLYHPYRESPPSSSPTGFRLRDFVLNPCFDLFRGLNFIDARPPNSSPSTSPVKRAPSLYSDRSLSIHFPGHYAEDPVPRPSNPGPDAHRNAKSNAVPRRDSPPCCRCMSPKQFSLSREHSRSIPSHRRSQYIRERQEAFRNKYRDRYERMLQGRDRLTRLRREAEKLMKPEHMNDEDWIFLEQLRKLELDNLLGRDLERYRQEVARAREVIAKAEEEREEKKIEEELEDQQSMVSSFFRKEEEEARFRRMEEEAIRADEKRQRDFQAGERMVREYQAQRYHEEMARKAEEERRRREEKERREREERQHREREEREREERKREERNRREREFERMRREEEKRREIQERLFRERMEYFERRVREEQARVHAARFEQERHLREARERLAREEEERQRNEQARRAAEEEQIRQYFATYEAKWNELRTNTPLPPIGVEEMPWPVFGVVVSADQITVQDVKTFLFHPLRPGVEDKTVRDKVKSEVLRFHPDKFNTRIAPKIELRQQAIAQAIAGAVARILTTLMTEGE